MQKSASLSDQLTGTPPRGRGRPRAFDRVAALEQATRLFWEKGYEATSLADLTASMGIGPTSLYSAFGSKEGLYSEALQYYQDKFSELVWGRFEAAESAREAVEMFLLDSASVLTGFVADIPLGCMVTLSAVGSEGHRELGDLVRAARAATVERLAARLRRATVTGELPVGTDIQAMARFVQSVQYGMSILSRDGVSRDELQAVAQAAMLAWDGRAAGPLPVFSGPLRSV